MKNFILCCLLSAMLVLVPVQKGHCDFFESFVQGHIIGEMVRSSMERNRIARGQQAQNVYVNKYYDFSNLNSIFVNVIIPKNSEVDDMFIAKKYASMLESAFANKSVKISTRDRVERSMLSVNPNYSYLSREQKERALFNYACQNCDAVLDVYIYDYNGFDTSNVAVVFSMWDIGTKEDIMNDEDVRYSVRTSSKEKLLEKITDKFLKEFFDVMAHNKR